MADATITFNTSVDPKGFEKDLDSLGDKTGGLEKSLRDVNEAISKAFQVDDVEGTTSAIMKQQAVVDALKVKLNMAAEVDGTTAAMMKQQGVVDNLQRKINAIGEADRATHFAEQLQSDIAKTIAEAEKLDSAMNEVKKKLEEPMRIVGMIEGMDEAIGKQQEALSMVNALAERFPALRLSSDLQAEFDGVSAVIDGVDAKISKLRELLPGVEIPDEALRSFTLASGQVELFEKKAKDLYAELGKTVEIDVSSFDSLNDALDSIDDNARTTIETLNRDMSAFSEESKEAYGRADALNAKLSAIKIPEQPKESIDELARDLGVAAQKLDEMKNKTDLTTSKLVDDFGAANKKLDEMKGKAAAAGNETAAGMRKASGETRRTATSMDGLSKTVEKTANRIKSLAAGVFVFNVLRSALKGFKDYLVSALMDNEAFARSFNQFKANVTAAVQPILNALIPALAKVADVFAYISGVILQIVATITNQSVQQLYAQAKARDKATRQAEADHAKEMETHAKRMAEEAERAAAFQKKEQEKYNKEIERREKLQAANADKHAKAVEKQAKSQQKYLDKLKKSNKEMERSTASFDDLITLSINADEELDGLGLDEELFKDIPFEELKFDDLEIGVYDAVYDGIVGAVAAGLFDSVVVPEIDDSSLLRIRAILDGILEKLKELGGWFVAGFDIGFGDVDFQRILDHINGIGRSLKNIFSDPDVRSAFEGLMTSFLYNLGKVVGSIGSIISTIAENIVGGIDLYLSQNEDRIKKHIEEIARILTTRMALIGDIFVDIADIFSIFRSDEAKQVTADLIGIFVEAGAGIFKVMGTIGNDMLEFLWKPISENKDKIKDVFASMFGPLHTILDTFKRAIQDTFDTWLRVHDEKFKPALDKISGGLSELFGNAMDLYMKHVAPTVERIANGIKGLYNEHIKPFVDAVMELAGSVAEFIAMAFDKWIKPAFKWIQDTIVPIIVPIFEYLWNTVKNVFGFIIDLVKNVINGFKGLLDFFTGIFSGDFEKAMKGLEAMIKAPFDSAKAIIDYFKVQIEDTLLFLRELFSGIVDVIIMWVESMVEKIKGAIENGLKFVQFLFAGAKDSFMNIWDSIKNAFQGVLDSMKNAWNVVWEGMGNVAKSIVNGIIGIINGVSNAIGSGINGVIDALNKLNFTLPDWMGGHSVGLNLSHVQMPQIPRLAQGAVLPGGSPFMAVLGDQPRGQTNIEAPLETIQEAVANVFAQYASQFGDNAYILKADAGDLTGFFRMFNLELQRANSISTAF